MGFFPYESFYIETQLHPEEIERLLRNNLQTEPGFGFSFKPAVSFPYYGWATINRFRIRRNGSYRNAFLPLISGSVVGDSPTYVHVKMRLSIVIQIFLLLWLVVVGYFAVRLSIKELKYQEFDSSVLTGYGMLAFVYLLATISFKWESSRAKGFLKDLFKGEIKRSKPI